MLARLVDSPLQGNELMAQVPSKLAAKKPYNPLQRAGNKIRVSPLLLQAAESDTNDVLARLGTSIQGLSDEEAQRRLRQHGPNIVTQEGKHGWLRLLFRAVINPLVILLLVLAAVSFVTGDPGAGTVMIAMVFLGVSLRFVQELRAEVSAAKLKSMIRVTATVVRDGQPSELPLAEIVPGDIIRLAAGDMIPADVRVLSCKDLFVIQASLTGESFPVEKFDARENPKPDAPLEHTNICFLGTSVESGTATAVVVATGLETYLGSMATAITGQRVETEFDRGVNRFTWLMLRFIAVMTPLVFIINWWTKGDANEAFFFAVAVAVGLTPEMLPMIVTVCLSKGALAMSRKKVIIKRLHSIQNFGAIDVLCTDKTGTLTRDQVILERYCDVVREVDEGVLVFAYLNSHFQTGLKNVLDRAILGHKELREQLNIPEHRKLDEIPFDFSRKLMSVAVETPEGTSRLICKGAPEAVFSRCSHFELNGQVLPIQPILIADLREEHDALSADGFRVLAVAYRDWPHKDRFGKEHEKDLILKGYVAFLDPPKESVPAALEALQRHGVTVKVLTGDNELVSRKICRDVGLIGQEILLGPAVERMSDAQLADAAEKSTIFARLSPAHKQRIIAALKTKGHVVGFLGDGINDAPALRAADVGISVDTAVDIAKESADVILLEKSLMVLEEGVLEGRRVFANIQKYIRMGASSNFGNMFSVLGASIFLPYLPMAPIQVLTNNLLYDFSQVPIPTDDVDPEQVARPAPWSMGHLTRFILFLGPCSSIFDYSTYLVMLFVFHCWIMPADSPDIKAYREHLFQTGWFVESLLTQTLIIHVIRTNRIPFLQSRASWPILFTTAAIMIIGMWLPFSPVAKALNFVPLPNLYWPIVAATLLCYVVVTQLVKTWLLRRGWI
jgi:Mg2+-importing ATPase